MFYLKTGIYMYYVVLNGEVHLVGKGTYPESDPASFEPYLEALNRDFLYMPNWEALGVLTLLQFREDNNTARYFAPGSVFYEFKKTMRADAWQEARRVYPATSFEYTEMPDGSFPEITRTFTFTRDSTGQWVEGKVPTPRAMFSSVLGEDMDFAKELLKIAEMLPEACGDDGECKCGGEGDDCGCSDKTTSWYDTNWYDDGPSNWYEEELSKEATDEDLDASEDDDDVVEALRKRTQKSRFTDYKNQRKRLRTNPSYRRKRNREQRKKRRKSDFKLKQKRYRKRTKNSPRSRRRSPRKF